MQYKDKYEEIWKEYFHSEKTKNKKNIKIEKKVFYFK